MNQLPLYQCHKKVRAAKIVRMDRLSCGNVLHLDNGAKVDVDLGWLTRNPALAVGGYFVEYQNNPYDGYSAYSPAVPFESGYTAIPGSMSASSGLNFGRAVEVLKSGKRVARVGWNGKGMFVYMVPANAYPASTDVAKNYFGGGLVPYNAYLAIKNVGETVSTWVPSINDVLAEDWEVLDA